MRFAGCNWRTRRWGSLMTEGMPAFLRTQLAFAAHIREPGRAPKPPDVADHRMAAYRELFFNNIESFLATGFPVLKSVLKEEAWTQLIRDFYARHRCQTPLFLQIPQEFLSYLEHERPALSGDPPFMNELAHYEWVELALAVAEDEPPILRPDLAASLPNARLSVSPVAWPLAYRFPVHDIGPVNQPDAAPAVATFLVVYRDREDIVRFSEINQATYLMLQGIQQNPGRLATDCLREIAAVLSLPRVDDVFAFGLPLLAELHGKGVIALSD